MTLSNKINFFALFISSSVASIFCLLISFITISSYQNYDLSLLLRLLFYISFFLYFILVKVNSFVDIKVNKYLFEFKLFSLGNFFYFLCYYSIDDPIYGIKTLGVIYLSIFLTIFFNKFLIGFVKKEISLFPRLILLFLILGINAIIFLSPKYINNEGSPSTLDFDNLFIALSEDIQLNYSKNYELKRFNIKNNYQMCNFLEIKDQQCSNENIFKNILNSNKFSNKSMLISQMFGKQVLDKLRQYSYISFNEGFIAHHYNAIFYNLYKDNDSMDSQYGIGMNYLIKEFSKILNYSFFQSTLILIFIFNSFVLLFFGLFNFYKNESLNLIIFTFVCTGFLLTFSSSSYLAPMLYPIRVLPIFLLIFYYFHFKKINIYFELITYFLFVFISFEYSLFFIFSLIMINFIHRNYRKVLIFLSIFFMFFLFHIAHTNSIYLPSYIFYFSGLKELGKNHPVTLLFYIFLLYNFYHFIKIKLHNEYIIGLLLFFTIFCLLKVIWVNSFNHISFILTFIGLIFTSAIKLKIINNKLIVFNLFTFFFFLILSLYFFTSQISPKFNFIHYEKYKNENIYIASHSNTKIREFRQIYKDGDLLLSNADNLISTFNQIKSTGMYYDLSTNSIYRQFQNYDDFLVSIDPFNRFIFDKDIFNSNLNSLAIDRVHAEKYMVRSNEFKKIISTLNLKPCGETSLFKLFCR